MDYFQWEILFDSVLQYIKLVLFWLVRDFFFTSLLYKFWLKWRISEKDYVIKVNIHKNPSVLNDKFWSIHWHTMLDSWHMWCKHNAFCFCFPQILQGFIFFFVFFSVGGNGNKEWRSSGFISCCKFWSSKSHQWFDHLLVEFQKSDSFVTPIQHI